MKLLESSENYLETIYILQKRNGGVRAIDIATELGYSKASVSVALKQLRENDYIKVEHDNNIVLLEKGLNIAQSMYERHVILTNALKKIGVSEEVAAQDACKIEHIISTETFQAIKNFINKGNK